MGDSRGDETKQCQLAPRAKQCLQQRQEEVISEGVYVHVFFFKDVYYYIYRRYRYNSTYKLVH